MLSICEVCNEEKYCMELDVEWSSISVICEECRNQLDN